MGSCSSMLWANRGREEEAKRKCGVAAATFDNSSIVTVEAKTVRERNKCNSGNGIDYRKSGPFRVRSTSIPYCPELPTLSQVL